MNFQRWNKVLSWAVFAITLIVYFLTAQRTISFWDSPEFVSSAYKLQVSHPPGAPLYLMLARIFVLVFPKSMVAFACTLFSVVCAGFTIKVLYMCIAHIAQKIVGKGSEMTDAEGIAVLASAFVGSLSMIFAHSYWEASTETEVYTLSTLLMALAFWFALKWEAETEPVKATRWLLLLAFILGLSVGVHIMNFAIVFPVAMLVILKKYGFNWKSISIAFVAGLVLFFALKNGLVTGILSLAAKLDIWLVNSYGLPFNSGIAVAYLLLAGILVWGLLYTRKRKKYLAHHLLIAVSLFMIGWSSYGMVLVRSISNTPISSDASNPKRLKSYLNAEQFDFGSRKLIKGPAFNAPLDLKKPFLDGNENYEVDREKGQYVMTNDGKYMVANYDKRFDLWFPRLYDRRKINIEGFYNWIDIEGTPIEYTDHKGNKKVINKPTFGENLSYFFKYQLMHLNIRYLMWNFAGIQNRNFGSGDPLNGNWMSGINFADFKRVGNTALISERNMDLKDRNNFYLLPLLLGLFGLVFLFLKDRNLAVTTLIFYLAFSVAITIFVNQLAIHLEIRDRDYIFLGAYFAFCIWIGLGVLGLFKLIPKLKENRTKAYIIGGVCFLAVPFQMGAKGWNDHDRSWNRFNYQLGKAYLDACEPNALLITTGDNATFPIWYLQEVEGYRTDVRLINYELLNIDHYINKLRRKINTSPPVKMSLPQSAYINGVDKLLPLIDKLKPDVYTELGQVVDFASSDVKTLWNGRNINYFPTTRFSLKADTNKLIEQGVNPDEYRTHFVPAINWELKKSFYSIADLVLMDILSSNNWERPICFTNIDYYDHFIGLNKYCVIKGVVNELLPLAPNEEKTNNRMYDKKSMEAFLMSDTSEAINLSDVSKYHTYASRDISRSVFRPAFFYLADAYLEENNKDEVEKILDRCIEMIPDTVVQFRKYMFDVGKLYYKIGKTEKARSVMSKIVDNLFVETHHFTSFSPANKFITRTRATLNIQIIGIIAQELEQYDKDMAVDIRSKHGQLQREMDAWLRQNFD